MNKHGLCKKSNKVLLLSTAISIQLSSIFALSIAAGRLAGGVIMKYLSWNYVIIIGLILAGVLILLILPLTHTIQTSEITMWSQVPIAAYLFPLIGFFIAPIYPTLCSSVLSKLPAYQQSAMTGLIVVFSALGGTIGSRIVSILFSAMGGQKAFYFTIVPIVIMLLAVFMYKKLHANFRD